MASQTLQNQRDIYNIYTCVMGQVGGMDVDKDKGT